MFKSLKSKFTLLLLSFGIPIVIFTVFSLEYSISTIKNNTLELMDQELSSKISMIDLSLESSKNTIESNYSMSYINQFNSAPLTNNGLYFFYQDTKEMLNNFYLNNDSYISFFNYTPGEDYLILSQFSSLQNNQDAFVDCISSLSFPADNGKWRIAELNDYSILLYTVKFGGNIMGLYVKLDDLASLIFPADQLSGFYFITNTEDSIVVSSDEERKTQALEYLSEQSPYQGISRTSDYGYRLYYIFPSYSLFDYADLYVYMLAFIALLIVSSHVFMNYYIFKPLNRLCYGLVRVQSNDYTYRMNESLSSTEFNTLSCSFNAMSKKISQLIDDIQDREKAKRKAELVWLKHQINPHFLLNNMNLIYTLASDRQYEKIQQLSKYLFDYMRYTLRVEQSSLPLGEELYYLRNYLSILQFNYPDHIHYQIQCDDFLLQYPVPTFILNTILENSVKHSLSLDQKALHISLEITKVPEEAGTYIHISIADNGNGYPEEIITQINRNDDLDNYFSSHIGLKNIKYRLYLHYNENNLLQLSNRNGSAVTLVKIPISERSDFS